jgi:uncharacterized protein YehS (DUF1456 family)
MEEYTASRRGRRSGRETKARVIPPKLARMREIRLKLKLEIIRLQSFFSSESFKIASGILTAMMRMSG